MISKLIEHGYKAIIVECGHGALLSNEFLSVPSASKLVITAKQPYSKEAQAMEYPTSRNLRSVSKEFIANIMSTELVAYSGKFNNLLCFATSFQLGDYKTLTHGYFGIGISINGVITQKVYHLSYYIKDRSKENLIETIFFDLLATIEHNIFGTNDYNPVDTIDGVWDVTAHDIIAHPFKKLFTPNINETLQLNTLKSFSSAENFICITPNNDLVRFEDIIRLNTGENKGIILQKGSYNPFHRMHRNIAENAKVEYPTYPHVLMLSINTCDKGNNSTDVLIERIRNLTKLGYYVIVGKEGMFMKNIEYIRGYYENLHIIFPVGEDTIERFLRDWEEYYDIHTHEYLQHMRYNEYVYYFKNVDWFISKRISETKHFGDLIPEYKNHLNNFKYSQLEIDNISSTSIRNGDIENIL